MSKKNKKHPLADKLKSLKHQATHPLETLKNVVKNVAKEAKKLGGGAAMAATFVPLRLLEPVMRNALDKKGIHTTTKDGVPKIAGLFMLHVIKGKNLENIDRHDAVEIAEVLQKAHLENFSSGYRQSNIHHVDESPAETAITQGATMLADNSGVPGAGIAVRIIHKIIDFIKGMGKKAKGQPLTADEKSALGSAPVDPALVAESEPVQNQIAANYGGVDTDGNYLAVNKNGETTHILKKDGTVIETGAPHALKPLKHGIFGHFFHHHVR